jgi:outer membrane protein assembly factor BamB
MTTSSHRGLRRLAVPVLSATVLVVALVVTPMHRAAAGPGPTVSVPVVAIWAGQSVVLNGSGFLPNTPETIELGSTLIGHTVTSATGTIFAAVPIPWGSAEGPTRIGVLDTAFGPVTTPLAIRTTWPQFRRGPSHQATDSVDTNMTETSTGGTVQTLHTQWQIAFGSRVIASPAVADGLVFIGAENKVFKALDANTGATHWSFTASGGIYASPAVVNDVVYFAGGSTVYARNADTGAALWSFTTGGRIVSSPTVSGGVLYIGSDDGSVYALNVATGALVWTHATGGAVESSPAVSGGRVFVGSQDTYLYALDQATGQLDWRHKTGDQVQSSPVVNGSSVYVGSNDGKIYALRTSTGATLWTFQTRIDSSMNPTKANGSPSLNDGVLTLQVEFDGQSPSSGWLLFSINATTGAVTASTEASGSRAPHTATFTSSPSIMNGLICGFSGLYTGVICDTRFDFGEHEGSGLISTPGSRVASSALADGRIFFADVAGNVFAGSL